MSVRRPMVAALAALSLLGAGLVSSSAALAAEALEAPATPTAEGVTATTAKLKGELNPGAGAAESSFHFLYTPGTSATGCEGTAAPEPAETGAGNHHAVGPQEVTGLQPNTEYAFCLQAFNETEALSSAVATFKTLELAPGVEGPAASSVTPFDAVLEAQINPNNAETSYYFEYATNEALTGATKVPVPSGVLNGFGNQTASADIGGTLTPSTEYFFKVVATNAKGTTESAPVQHFTTLAAEKPIVEAQSAIGVKATEATIEAQVNPNYQSTETKFEYATNEALTGATTVAGPTLVGFGNQAVSLPLTGLAPNQLYYFRVTATNNTGTTEGAPVVSFHTLSEPLVVTGANSNITRTTAALAGTVDPAGVFTTYRFVYGTTESYGSSTSPVSAEEGFANVVASAALEELKPGVTYHYALVASNTYGTVTGADHTFTTLPPTPPTASTGGTVNVGHQTAILTGTIEPDGLSTTYEFQLGTQAGVYYPQTFGSVSGSGGQPVALELQSLAPGVTYHYRLVATNQDGTSYGQDQTFTTESYPNPLTVPVSPALIPVPPVAVTPPAKVVAKKPTKKPKKHKKSKKKKKKK
jgi:hypothetical protein